jgi:hypothetical protein
MLALTRGAVALALAACGETVTNPDPAPPPALENLAAEPRTGNVLSLVVSGRARHADSVAARYGVEGATLDSVAPAVRPAAGAVELPVLGLLPETSYTVRVLAYGPGGSVSSEPMQVTTGSLPDDLPRFHAGGSSPSPGYLLFAAGMYGVIIDDTGRVVWYVRFPDGPSLNFQAQANGRYVARPTTADPTDIEPLVEFDPLGNLVRRLGCAGGLRPRFHDVLVEPDGSWWLMCDEVRVMDLSALGGVTAAEVTGTVVQHLDPSGGLLFQWSAFDHFHLTDVDQGARSGPTVNWTHGNSLDLDTQGNLLVSFRNLNEITKIDSRTGAVRWRMGGLRNEFSFAEADPPFLRQHGARVTSDGGLILLDNYGEVLGSRAERYLVNEAARTARLTGAYAPTLATRATLGGTTQILPDQRTLVAFGDGGVVQEYDSGGAVVWQIEGDAGYVFRAQRIRSLYRPATGFAR